MRRLLRSFQRAARGLRLAAQEPNFQLEAIAGIGVVLVALGLRVGEGRFALLAAAVLLLLILEAINTAVEKFVDLVEPKLNHLAAQVKDLMAAAVTLAAVNAVATALLVILPAVAALALARR